MSIVVIGASDDLIEVDGDIREEFNVLGNDEGSILGFSNGTVLRVRYDDEGVWRITPLWHTTVVKIDYASDDTKYTYSDVATIDEPVDWVVCGTEWVNSK